MTFPYAKDDDEAPSWKDSYRSHKLFMYSNFPRKFGTFMIYCRLAALAGVSYPADSAIVHGLVWPHFQ